MALFEEFLRGSHLHMLNFGTINLTTKSSDAKQMQRYKPIRVWTLISEIRIKVATDRMTIVAQKVVHSSQTKVCIRSS